MIYIITRDFVVVKEACKATGSIICGYLYDQILTNRDLGFFEWSRYSGCYFFGPVKMRTVISFDAHSRQTKVSRMSTMRTLSDSI